MWRMGPIERNQTSTGMWQLQFVQSAKKGKFSEVIKIGEPEGLETTSGISVEFV